MTKQSNQTKGELFVLSPEKSSSNEGLKAALKGLLKERLVRSIDKVKVPSVDNIGNYVLGLSTIMTIKQIIEGRPKQVAKKDKKSSASDLTAEFGRAEGALDSALKSSKNSRKEVQEMTNYLADVNRRARIALEESKKIS